MPEKHFCPNCGSRNVSADTDGFVKRWRNADVWLCDNCGYSGFMPQGDPDEVDFEKDEAPESEELYQTEPLNRRQLGILLILLSLFLAALSILI